MAWLERVIHIVPVGGRPDGYNPLGDQEPRPGLDRPPRPSGRACYDAIVAMDLDALGESLNECSRAWEPSCPSVYGTRTIKIDLRGLLAAYTAGVPGSDVLRLRRRLPHRRLRGPAARLRPHLGAGAWRELWCGRAIVEASLDDLRSDDVRFLQEAAALGPVHVRVPSDGLVECGSAAAAQVPGCRAALPGGVDTLGAQRSDRGRPIAATSTLPPDRRHGRGQGRGRGCSVREAPWRPGALAYRVVSPDAVPASPSSSRIPLPDAPSVVVTGCFDWLHSGHVRFFMDAAQHGALHVVVGSDRNVGLLKGEGHPLQREESGATWSAR